MNFFDSVVTAAAAALISLPAAWLGAGAWALVVPGLPLFAVQVLLFTRMSRIGLKPSSPHSSRSYFRSATKLWLAGASDAAFLRADKFLLGRFGSMADLGDYNRAFNFTPLAARALNSFLASPTVAALTRTPDQRARRGLITKASLLLLVAGLANFVLWWFFSKPLVPWLFGPQWVNAIPVFEAMAPLSLAMSIAYLPTTLALANRAYGILAAVRLVALAAFVVAALLLAPRMTPVTMAWLFQLTLIGQGLALSLAMLAFGSKSRRISAEE